MVKLVSVLLMALIILLYNQIAYTQENISEEESNQVKTPILILPAGTPLDLVLVEELYSQRNNAGDEILFLLKNDIVLMGRTYLVKGTPVLGRLTEVKSAKSKQRDASLEYEISSIVPPYGMPILLQGIQQRKGEETPKEYVVTDYGVSQSNKKGSTTNISIGSEITIFTSKDGVIADMPVEEMRKITDEWLHNKILDNFLSFSWDKKCDICTAFSKAGYNITRDMISISPIEDYKYEIIVTINDTQAIFNFRPFDNVHTGGYKFRPLTDENEFAKKIMGLVK